jgi:hypothetical protein
MRRQFSILSLAKLDRLPKHFWKRRNCLFVETHITNSFCRTVLQWQGPQVVNQISFRNVAPISVYCYYRNKTMHTALLRMLTNVLNFMLPAPHRRLSGDFCDIALSALTSTAYCSKLLRKVICNNRTFNHESHE